MSKNIFKTNSRFDVLREDYSNKKNNKNENQPIKENIKSKENTKSKETKQLNKEEKKINKNTDKKDYLNKKINLIEENFPQLINVTKKENKTQENKTQEKEKKEEKKTNYIDKVNILKKTNIISNVEDDVKPGWVKLEKNKITKKITIKYGKRTYLSDDEKEITPEDILSTLVKSYERRKNEYIRDWGEESYEKTFKFINYDYDYFERLDEEFEINQMNEDTFSDEELEYNY